tara:strand:- start:514 stop:723 length:210 start_codon:yes stop_codon:yes gene_type:complete
MKKDKKIALTLWIILIIIIVLASEFSDYRTKKVLEVEGQKAEERLKLANEKDSVNFQKYNVQSKITDSK